MKKLFLLLALGLTFAQFEAVAHAEETAHPAAGMPIVSADGHGLGVIYKVTADGSVRLIYDGKMEAIDGSTLQEEHASSDGPAMSRKSLFFGW